MTLVVRVVLGLRLCYVKCLLVLMLILSLIGFLLCSLKSWYGKVLMILPVISVLCYALVGGVLSYLIWVVSDVLSVVSVECRCLCRLVSILMTWQCVGSWLSVVNVASSFVVSVLALVLSLRILVLLDVSVGVTVRVR